MIASGDSPSGSAGAKAPRIGALRTLFAILALAAAVRVANLALMSRLPIADFQRAWQESDMAFNWTWSGRILAGDVLGRDTVYEYTDWMQSMAPLDTWQRWWGGQHIFYQAPLYPYTLAGMRLRTCGSMTSARPLPEPLPGPGRSVSLSIRRGSN